MRGYPIITVGSAGSARVCCPPPTTPCTPAGNGVPALPAFRFPPCRNGVLIAGRRVRKLFSPQRVSKLMGGCR